MRVCFLGFVITGWAVFNTEGPVSWRTGAAAWLAVLSRSQATWDLILDASDELRSLHASGHFDVWPHVNASRTSLALLSSLSPRPAPAMRLGCMLSFLRAPFAQQTQREHYLPCEATSTPPDRSVPYAKQGLRALLWS